MAGNFGRRELIYAWAVFASSLVLKACSSNNQSTTQSNASGGEGFKIAIAPPWSHHR